MENQKLELITFVRLEREKGRTLSSILSNMKISKYSYHRWVKAIATPVVTSQSTRVTSRSVTDGERNKIDEMKLRHPGLRHRQIQGLLQGDGIFLSSSTVYEHLKAQGKVEPYGRRAAPWDEPLYEVTRANVMWGADWTKLRVGGVRWYLLNLIDFYSRLVVHFEIVPTVNAGRIKELH